jgi:hypothetical protein
VNNINAIDYDFLFVYNASGIKERGKDMNRVMTFGVLLLAFASTMLGYQPQGTGTLPMEWYQVLGVASLVVAVFFLVLAARKKWSDWGEGMLNNRMYPVWVVMYVGLYIISFLKGFVGVVQAKQPNWIQYAVFIIGYTTVIYIIFIALIKPLFKKVEKKK